MLLLATMCSAQLCLRYHNLYYTALRHARAEHVLHLHKSIAFGFHVRESVDIAKLHLGSPCSANVNADTNANAHAHAVVSRSNRPLLLTDIDHD